MQSNKVPFFSLKVHHGGHFTSNLVLEYSGGQVNYVDYLYEDDLTMTMLEHMSKRLNI